MTFTDFQMLMLVRQMEQQGGTHWQNELAACAPNIESELQKNAAPFQRNAVARARQMADVSGVSMTYRRVRRRFRSLIYLLYMLMAALGFFAVLQTLSAPRAELNVYWLLLFIIGIHSVSMLLWLGWSIVSAFKADSPASHSPLIKVYRKGLQWLTRETDQAAFLSAWRDAYLSGRIGRWFGSKHVHAAWLWYLLGSLAALLLTLSGKQYDFVWGTTILSSTRFVQATEVLGILPQALGVTVPSGEQILASRIGQEQGSNELMREIWANFILVCVALYALLPRFLLWCCAVLMLNHAKATAQPDWEQPYFYALRTKLLPARHTAEIVDPDDQTTTVDRPITGLAGDLLCSELNSLILPANAFLTAYEWGADKLPAIPLQEATHLGAVNNANDQRGVLQALQQSGRPVVLLVNLRRSADRGAARFMQQLMALSELQVLLIRTQPDESDRARLAGWQALMEKINLPANQWSLVELP